MGMAILVIHGVEVWLANCYFAHDSSILIMANGLEIVGQRRQPAHSAKLKAFDIRFLFAYALALWRKERRHELTHSNGKRGTADNSQSLGLAQPSVERLLRVSRNGPALALLPATATLCEKPDSLPGRRKPDQPAPPSAFRERAWF